jgi:hypothetical protein
MNPEKAQFLSLPTPGRVTAEQAGWILGFEARDIPILVRAHLLKPLGNPNPCSHKYFAGSEIEILKKDAQWLDKASRVMRKYWEQQNSRRSASSSTADSL